MFRMRGRDNTQLIVASTVSGITGAGFVFVARGALGLESFAPVAQLWTIWSLGAASLLFAFQQWAIHSGVTTVYRAIPSMGEGPRRLLQGSILGSALVLVLLRDRLFHASTLYWPIAAVVILVGTTFVGIARGIQARDGNTRALSVLIAGENLIRFVFAVLIALFGGSRGYYGMALVCGFAIVAIVGRRSTHTEAPESTSGEFAIGSATVAGFLSIAAFLVPTMILAYNGAPPELVSTLFLVLTAVRLPHLILQSGTPKAGALFTRWVADGDVARIRRAHRVIATLALEAALIAALLGYFIGDPVVGRVFDIRGQVNGATYAGAAITSILSLATTFATVLLVSTGQHRLLLIGWLVPAAIAGLAALLLRTVDLTEMAAGLVVLHLVILLLLTVPVGWRSRT